MRHTSLSKLILQNSGFIRSNNGALSTQTHQTHLIEAVLLNQMIFEAPNHEELAGALHVHGFELACGVVCFHVVVQGEMTELFEKWIRLPTAMILLLQQKYEPACLIQALARLT